MWLGAGTMTAAQIAKALGPTRSQEQEQAPWAVVAFVIVITQGSFATKERSAVEVASCAALKKELWLEPQRGAR